MHVELTILLQEITQIDSVPFKQIDAILIFTTNWQAISQDMCAMPSAIKWKIIKSAIPLITHHASISLLPQRATEILKQGDSLDGAINVFNLFLHSMAVLSNIQCD